MVDEEVVRYGVTVPSSLMERIKKDRGVGHRLLMSLLTPTALDKDSPREAAKLLWTIASPTQLLVSSAVKLEPTHDIGIDVVEFGPKFVAGESYQVETSVEASHTPTSWVPEEIWALPNRPAIRNKRVPVPDSMMQDWFTRKLERCGLEVKKWKATEPFKFRAKKKRLIAARISVEVVVKDESKANGVLLDGLGRSKNFGCGLLQLARIK